MGYSVLGGHYNEGNHYIYSKGHIRKYVGNYTIIIIIISITNFLICMAFAVDISNFPQTDILLYYTYTHCHSVVYRHDTSRMHVGDYYAIYYMPKQIHVRVYSHHMRCM